MKKDVFFELLSQNRILTSVLLEITRKCNWRCDFCYLGDDHRGELSKDEIIKLLYEIKELGGMKVAFTGGEPFIRDDALEIFTIARQLGLACEVNTNGSLISRFGYQQIADLFASINISLHSHIPEIHDSLVGINGAWGDAVEAVRQLRKARAHVEINSVITKAVIPTYTEFKKFVEDDLGCRWHPDTRIMQTFSGDKKAIETHQADESQLASILHDNNNLMKSVTQEGVFCTGVCKAGRNTCFIDVDGYVYPCITFKRDDPESRALLATVETIKNVPFTEIWKNNRFLLEVGTVKPEDFAKCRDCESYTKCFKCMAENYFATGSMVTPSSHICHVERFYAHSGYSQSI